jgi:hypothetical protein
MEEVNFKVVQGDTFKMRVTYKNPNGTVIDLSDYSAKMDVRNEPAGKILCATINSSSGIDIDGPNGTIDIEFTPAQTRKFTTPSAAYQLKIINDTTGEHNTLVRGYLSVTPAVIR